MACCAIAEYWSRPSLLLDSNSKAISNSTIAAAIASQNCSFSCVIAALPGFKNPILPLEQCCLGLLFG